MPIYEYFCPVCDVKVEELRKMDEREIPAVCPDCNGAAKFTISAPRASLEGITGDFPGAYDHWEKIRKQKQQQEVRKKQKNGEPLQ